MIKYDSLPPLHMHVHPAHKHRLNRKSKSRRQRRTRERKGESYENIFLKTESQFKGQIFIRHYGIPPTL